MKKLLATILSILFLISCACLTACNIKRRGEEGATEQGSYEIRYYFSDNTGSNFELDSLKTETGTLGVGKTISVTTPKTFDGYVFDEDNENNRLLDTISLQSTAHVDLYYLKTGSYKVSYYFENTDGEFVLNEEETETGVMGAGKTVSVTDPKTFTGYEFDADNGGNVLSAVINAQTTTNLSLFYKISLGETPVDRGRYVIKHYFEDANGQYVYDPSKDRSGLEDVGETFTESPAAFDYYNFNSEHENNVLSGQISNEQTLELKHYFDRCDFYLTVEGGTASKTEAKWGATITLTPTNPDNVWEIVSGENTGVVIDGNTLIMGKGDVSIRAITGKEVVISEDYYVKADGSNVEVTLNVVNSTAKQGVITLYNKPTTINTVGAMESYYIFTTEGTTASFGVYNGTSVVEVKSASITQLSLVAQHRYSIQVNSDKSVVCSIDGTAVLTISEAEITAKNLTALTVAGRVGTYNSQKTDNCVALTVPNGSMTLQEMKNHFNVVLTRVPSVYYVFNHTTSLGIERKEETVPLNGISGYYEKYVELVNEINLGTSVADFIALSEEDGYRIGALKQHVLSSLGYFASLYNDCLLMPMVSSSIVQVCDVNTGVPIDTYIDANIHAKDTRWWVPNAYMLRSNWDAPNNLGVLDMLEKEVAETNDFDAIYNIPTKYIDDIVRALSFKGVEFYYWHEYNKDSESVYPPFDHFLYTYYGAKGAGFEYVGDVFEDYTWSQDFRLTGVFFKNGEGSLVTDDVNQIMAYYTWMLTHQTLKEDASVTYNVTLNALGGTLSETTIVGNMGANLTLPVPEKTGATFDGWYQNRCYEGAKIETIPAGSNRNDLMLFAKWLVGSEEQTLAVDPADIFGSDMIIQRNQPFNVFGSGINGTAVTVDLDGVTKTATVENGKWSVTFDAMEATFTPKTLTISGGDIEYEFNGVLVGEVWLGAGQSNMQMTLSWMNATGVEYVGQYGYYDNFKNIRIYRQQIPGSPYDSEPHLTNTWDIMNNPNEAISQTALGLSFALNLQKKLNVPVGVIASCMGATYIEEWLSNESLAQTGSVIEGTDEENEESRYYYGMTELLRGIKIAGVIWYQGENNAYAYNYSTPICLTGNCENRGAKLPVGTTTCPKCNQPIKSYPNAVNVSYDEQLAMLHSQYKDVFGNANLPLIVVELAPYAWDDYEDFRIVQRKFVTENANAYLLSTVDIGTPYDIHPVYKNEVGKRASRIALEYVYNDEDVTDSLSYYPASATKSGSTITIAFGTGKTIKANGALIGFKVQNEQGKLESVTATVANNTIVINYSGNATSVYYMYVKDTVGVFNTALSYYIGQPGLYGGNDLPVAPFKIDIA